MAGAPLASVRMWWQIRVTVYDRNTEGVHKAMDTWEIAKAR